MTLAEYYKKEKSGKSLRESLNDIHAKVRSRTSAASTVEECKTLQDFLNHAFYPTKYGVGENGQDYTTAIRNLIVRAYEEQSNIAISDFKMGDSQVQYGATTETLPTLLQNLHESFSHKEKIYISTIEDRLQRVKNALAKANNITGAEIDRYREDLGKLQSLLQQLADLKGAAVGAGGDKAYFDLKDKNKDLISLINDADKSFQALSSVGGVFGPREYGQVLEWVLEAFSDKTDKTADEVANQLVDDFINTAGSEVTGKSLNDFLSIGNIKFNGKNVQRTKKTKGESQKVTVADMNGNQFEFEWISSFNPDASRQGKMDVDFKFNDTVIGKQIPFRISAKNWQTLDRDFGETNVIYALLRSAGNEGSMNYMLAMQDKDNINNINLAHQLAKYSLVTDILMGLSQEEKFADTIVINVRSEERVIVGSIIDILDQIWDGLKNFDLPTYPGDTINQKLIILRTALQNSKGKTEQYQSLAMKYLQTIRVKLHYASIKNAIRTPLTT